LQEEEKEAYNILP